ncbi:MAG TPA: hypothetical protein VI037_06620 [Nitrososphaera sp.]
MDKSERKEFDKMFDIPRLYLSACSNSVQLVPLHPIIISILFHHYRQFTECLSEVEKVEDRLNNSHNWD